MMKKWTILLMMMFFVSGIATVFGCSCCSGECCTVQMSCCASVTVCEDGCMPGEDPEVDDWIRLPTPIAAYGGWCTNYYYRHPGPSYYINDTNIIPKLIATGQFDLPYNSGGTYHQLVNGEKFYYIMGNHTRFKIACNYTPYIQLSVPNNLSNGTSLIDVVHLELVKNENTVTGVNSGIFGPILPQDGVTESFHVSGGTINSGTNIDQCSIGHWDKNRYGIYAVIKLSENWYNYTSGNYVGTVYLTLNPSP